MNAMITKIRKTYAIRGCAGTINLCGSKVIDIFRRLTPSYRAAQERERNSDLEFDRKYGVDTSGQIHPDESTVKGQNWLYGNKYQGVSPNRFNETLKDLRIPFEEYVFIDFGSGKGRAVLMAAGFPFKKIVGIEYCDDLQRVAKENLTRYPSASMVCKNIDLPCMDASEYPLPNEPLVLYFYNPFGQSIMEKVIKSVQNSFEANPRPIVIVSMTTYYEELWDQAPFLKRIRPGVTIWQTASVNAQR